MNTQDSVVVSEDSDTTKQTQESSAEDTSQNVSTEAENDRSLKPAVRDIVEKFARLSSQEQSQKISNLEGTTARQEQKDAAKIIREMFDVQETMTQSNEDKTVELQKKIDEQKAVEEKLNQSQDRYTEVVERLDREERNQFIKQFLLNNKIDAEVDHVLEDKKFWESFYSTKDAKLEMSKRVNLAMLESYALDKSWIEKQKFAQSTGGMATGNAGSVQKKKMSIKDMKDMSLHEYEASKGLELTNFSK